MTKITAAKRVIKLAGGVSEMARLHGVNRQAVQGWLRHGIPATRVMLTATALGLAPRDVRPDVFA